MSTNSEYTQANTSQGEVRLPYAWCILAAHKSFPTFNPSHIHAGLPLSDCRTQPWSTARTITGAAPMAIMGTGGPTVALGISEA